MPDAAGTTTSRASVSSSVAGGRWVRRTTRVVGRDCLTADGEGADGRVTDGE
ncbi:hypothetical protein AB0N77_26320 [Streptomyces misionensis]|uniref:hypothetical protein n=1 Tax=Streptomyces misionensis TaxID=67331 RepID=UPI00342ECED2